jgi:hypothetical protein
MIHFVTYWWGGNDFKLLSKQWVKNCGRCKIKSHAIQKNWKKTYQEAINYKPTFILTMLKSLNHGVVYSDVDMVVHKHPDIFENKENFDLIFFNWNYDKRVSNGIIDPFTLETSGGLMYFNNTPMAIKLLKLWKAELDLNPKMADDRVLSIVFYKYAALQWCRCKWLPFEYFYIPEFYKHIPINPIISHPRQMTEETSKNRIPPEYRKLIKPKHHPHHISIV